MLMYVVLSLPSTVKGSINPKDNLLYALHKLYFFLCWHFLLFSLEYEGLVMGDDLAIDSGIFDFGNINFMSDLPGIGPHTMKTKGKAFQLH